MAGLTAHVSSGGAHDAAATPNTSAEGELPMADAAQPGNPGPAGPEPAGPAMGGSGARWDRNRVLFDVVDGGELIACAISREALQDASGRRYAKPPELLACFETLRERLEAVALAKFRTRPESIDGLVTIWSGDLEEDEEE